MLTGIFPALERALQVTNTGPLVLLTGYQTPAALRRIGRARLATWLRNRKMRSAAQLAQAAVQAAQQLTAQLVRTLAREVIARNEQITNIDALIEGRFGQHTHAEAIASLPGTGTLLGAEFLAATGGDMDAFGTPDRLAGLAGLAPAPRDSGRIRGTLHRPQRSHRGLNRVFYTSALISSQRCPESRRFHDRKRAQGKRHTQPVPALAQRRVNVVWALLRDRRCYHPTPPVTAAA